MQISGEQFNRSVRATKAEGNLIRVHSFWRNHGVADCFGTITDPNENVFVVHSRGQGKEMRIALHKLVFQTGIFGHKPHRNWRLIDTDGWSWIVIDEEYEYNRQRELLRAGFNRP